MSKPFSQNTICAFLQSPSDLMTLEAYLATANWQQEPDRAGMNVGHPEPVFVSWSERLGDGEIDYTYNPDTGMRMLEIRGMDAAHYYSELAAALPLSPVPVLGSNQKEHDCPSYSPFLSSHDRCQFLRWLMHDYTTATADILAVLQTALADPNWEVCATAMLAVAHFNARELGLQVRKCKIPDSNNRLGLSRLDRDILYGIQKAVIAHLLGEPIPESASVPAMEDWIHLRRCVAGLPVKRCDRMFLLAFSLTEPVPPCEPLPSNLPTTIIEDQDGYRLAQTDLALVWIPPIQHWLGDDLEHPLISNPIHSVHPETGFFITKYPLTQSRLQQLDISLVTNKTLNNQTEYCTCSWQEAQQICTDLSQKLGLAFTLPTPDEWEMAARGPDGRRFPWGNGLERNMLRSPSPWGCRDTVGIISQWTNNLSGSGEVIVCGGTNQLRCAMREIAAIEQANVGLRLVLRS